MKKDIILRAEGLSIGYRRARGETIAIQNGLDLALRGGELTALLGANGAGKSTLLRTLAAAQPPLGGRLDVGGRPLATCSAAERARLIGVVWTDRTQAGGLTVSELVGLGRQPHTGFFGRMSRTDKAIVGRALDDTGIAAKAGCRVGELSDGERQKAFIAKAIVQECPLILLDEPTAFLDAASRIEILGLLRRLAHEQGKAILLSTHDVEQALTAADRLWLLAAGKGMRCGVTEDVVVRRQLDGLFAQTGVRFDYATGTYQPAATGGRPVAVRAADALLGRWACNALRRNGFCPTAEDGPADGACLHIEAADALTWTAEGRTERFRSFEDWSDSLENR